MLTSTAPVHDIHDKASEIIRKIKDKVPLATLGKAKSCILILAVELACRCLNVPFNKERLITQANIPAKDIAQAIVNCKSLLRLNFIKASTMDILSLQFGANHRIAALNLLNEYQRLYIDRLDKSRQSLMDITAPEYHAAAYFLAAKLKKTPVDKKKLLEATEVSSQLFHKIMEDLEQICLIQTDTGDVNVPTGGMILFSTKSTTKHVTKVARAEEVKTNSRLWLSQQQQTEMPKYELSENGHKKQDLIRKVDQETYNAKPNSVLLNTSAKSPTQDPEKENRISGTDLDRNSAIKCEQLCTKRKIGAYTTDYSKDDLEAAALAAAQRSISCSNLLKKKVEFTNHSATKTPAALLLLQQQDKRREEGIELRKQAEKRKEQEREMYASWKEKLKKRRLETEEQIKI